MNLLKLYGKYDKDFLSMPMGVDNLIVCHCSRSTL